MKSVISDTRLNAVTRRVMLEGWRPIMFDRYAGDNQTKLSWWQTVYLAPGTRTLVIPTVNIMSFLSAHNTNSAPKRLRDSRKYKAIANACLSFVSVEGPPEHPEYIPFMREGAPIQMGEIENDCLDPRSGLFLQRSVARLEKGIPNPKERAVLPLPWSLEFDLTIFPNKEIKEQEIKNLFDEGGVAIGLGTFRGVYGKFSVTRWD